MAGNTSNDVTSNGDVVFWSSANGYNVYRYRAGTITLLASDTNLWNTYPVTDGINTIYRKHTPCCGNQTYAIALFGSAGEVILAPARPAQPYAGRDYQVKDGWAAYTKGTSGQLKIWTRSPAGIENQISFLDTSSWINSLGADGDVTWVNGDRMYLSRSGFTTLQIGSGLGQSFSEGGEWYITIGRSLFKIITDNNIPISLTVPQRLSNGQFRFRLTAAPGQRVVIQASSTLGEWIDIGTNSIAGGSIDFVDTDPNFERRFYRALTP